MHSTTARKALKEDHETTEVLTMVLEIYNQGPGRSQKSSIVWVYTGRVGLQTYA